VEQISEPSSIGWYNILSRSRGVTIDGVCEWVYYHLYTQLGPTSNYSAIADLHTLQITRAHAKSSPFAFTSRFLVTAPNKRYFSASVPTSFTVG
jgi:hypothetical protein